jgi:F0F1-type ATP synthase membrane subunit b/b'
MSKNTGEDGDGGESESRMDIIKLLNDLEALVEDTHTWWGMGIAFNFHQDEFMDQLNKIRASLPEDIKRASRLTQESQSMLEGARETAEQARIDAQADADRLIREAEDVSTRKAQSAEKEIEQRIKDANMKAQQMLDTANEQASKIKANAQAQAHKMLTDATEESQRLINGSEVMRLASVQAREIVDVAEGESHEMRRGADEYAHGVLMDLERQIADLMSTIQRGRGKLDQRVSLAQSTGIHTNGRANGEMAVPRR